MIVSLPRRPHGMWSHKQGAGRALGAGLDIIRAICRESIQGWVNDAQKRWVLPVNPWWWVLPVNPHGNRPAASTGSLYRTTGIPVPVYTVHRAARRLPPSLSRSFFQSITRSLFTLHLCACSHSSIEDEEW